MVCLWVGRRRWEQPRHHYKRIIGKAGNQRALQDLQRRQLKWRRQDARSAAGLEQLHWKQLRRIVGLNPWGEQLLYRVKTQALSLYSPVTGATPALMVNAHVWAR
ncbi:hypothetical protein PHMEG_00027822 [Phytophthora megakarya]|uniref:Uncharacterized protein n=1 Tax=Phytophthora megakarya TaxID=4795 RepID=A0A225V6C4_9STRA|nr:hypothetical protein PHMEG_00027822 [Phytophthora megakarya]